MNRYRFAFTGRWTSPPSLLLMASLVGVGRALGRQLPEFIWDCDLGKLYVSIFLYFTGLDFDNMYFKDDWARATLLWDTPSIEFVKAYLSVVCSEFEAPDDLKWWRKQEESSSKF
jgi:hypothetical protein